MAIEVKAAIADLKAIEGKTGRAKEVAQIKLHVLHGETILHCLTAMETAQSGGAGKLDMMIDDTIGALKAIREEVSNGLKLSVRSQNLGYQALDQLMAFKQHGIAHLSQPQRVDLEAIKRETLVAFKDDIALYSRIKNPERRVPTKDGLDIGRIILRVIDHLASRSLLAVAETDGWRPIETAPKDGSHFKVLIGDQEFDCYWYIHPSVCGWCSDDLDCNDFEFIPTLWKPAPPLADKE